MSEPTSVPIKHKGAISIDGTIQSVRTIPTTIGTVLIKPSPTVRPGARPTAGPTIVPTKTATPIPTPAPSPNNYRGGFPGCYYGITQYYGQNGEQGEDFGCQYHTRLLALWSGVVEYVGRTCWNPSCSSTSGGVIIIVSIVPGLGTESTYYLHIDSVAPGIFVGSHITKGQFIALSGGQLYGGQWPVSPVFSEGPHLEVGFDAWFLCDIVKCYGTHVSPYYYVRSALNG